MQQGGIFNGPNALGTAPSTDLVTITGQQEGEPLPWWAEPIKTTPWWHETPTLMQPLQERPWYMPEEQGPTTPEIIEEMEKRRSARTGLLVVGVLAGLALLAGALGRRAY